MLVELFLVIPLCMKKGISPCVILQSGSTTTSISTLCKRKSRATTKAKCQWKRTPILIRYSAFMRLIANKKTVKLKQSSFLRILTAKIWKISLPKPWLPSAMIQNSTNSSMNSGNFKPETNTSLECKAKIYLSFTSMSFIVYLTSQGSTKNRTQSTKKTSNPWKISSMINFKIA